MSKLVAILLVAILTMACGMYVPVNSELSASVPTKTAEPLETLIAQPRPIPTLSRYSYGVAGCWHIREFPRIDSQSLGIVCGDSVTVTITRGDWLRVVEPRLGWIHKGSRER